MKRVCVFCGSSSGSDPAFAAAAKMFGELLASEGLGLVFGGARVGLMGTIADAVLAGGGEAIGVLPRALEERELAHPGLTQLHVVGSMHERKAMMADLADGFVALPGGFGTLDEFCEVLTWAQLGIHTKPCGLLNVNGYYDGFLAQVDAAVTGGLTRPAHRDLILVATDPVDLLGRLRAYRSVLTPKWIDSLVR
ncbi:MAG TPA: TIGR00730 family Rossman fold protein [Candidatus Limnocylindria bacterium]|nr:TIGR00730 family Rossman fold protein [Candidatus Limnocylindria bacterium]